MARAKDKKVAEAEKLYKKGIPLVEIAKRLDKPPGTVRRWKSTYGWDSGGQSERSQTKANARKGKKDKNEEAAEEEIKALALYEKLTDRQMFFCIYYIQSFNATKAYMKAYNCKYETAAVEGSRILRNPKIKNIIMELKKNKLNRALLSEDDIFQKYMDIAFADMNDYMEIKHGCVMLKDSAAFDGTLVKKVSTGKIDSIELQDRMRALQWLSDHMDLATEKQKAEIAALKAKSGSSTDEEQEQRQQAKHNIESILSQLKQVEDVNVHE